jgi:HNH endonuclease
VTTPINPTDSPAPDTPIREPISKKLRFEVFKRDSFRCQYCGSSAPDVLLEVDHLKPVAEGGKSDILNLITACNPCNSGKGKRSLNDATVINKQLDQLKALNERREQLEMMIQWKEELSSFMEDSLSQYWSNHVPGYSLTEQGKRDLRKLMDKYELQEMLDAIPTAADQYLRYDKNGKLEPSSVDLAFSKIQGVCRTRRLEKKKPYIRDLFYIRVVLKTEGTLTKDR